MFQGNVWAFFKAVSGVCLKIARVFKDFKGRLKEFSRGFQESYKKVLKWFIEISRIFMSVSVSINEVTSWYKDVFRVFQKDINSV